MVVRTASLFLKDLWLRVAEGTSHCGWIGLGGSYQDHVCYARFECIGPADFPSALLIATVVSQVTESDMFATAPWGRRRVRQILATSSESSRATICASDLCRGLLRDTV
nr:hypothetical protein CFP56_09476 [Quercus suber]